jgi:hypothetical protein
MRYDVHMAEAKRIRRKDAGQAEKSSGSKTLAELAHRLGVKVENPIAFDPQSGRFYTAEDYARDKNLVDESHLFWLLNFAQRGDDSFTPNDELMLNTFAGLYTLSSPEDSPEALRKLAVETVADIRRFVVEHIPWELQIPNARCTLRWEGPYATAGFTVANWGDAFRLRAHELLDKYVEHVGRCKRVGCERLFLGADKRQEYCSRKCSLQVGFQNYKNSKRDHRDKGQYSGATGKSLDTQEPDSSIEKDDDAPEAQK